MCYSVGVVVMVMMKIIEVEVEVVWFVVTKTSYVIVCVVVGDLVVVVDLSVNIVERRVVSINHAIAHVYARAVYVLVCLHVVEHHADVHEGE